MKAILLALLLLVGCQTTAPTAVHSAYLDAYRQFYRDFPYALRVDMGFKDLEGSILGECVPWHNIIQLDVESSKEGKQPIDALVYHELGHCALGLNHKPDFNSLMHPYEVVELTSARIAAMADYHEATCNREKINLMEEFLEESHPSLRHRSCETRFDRD